MTKETPPGLVDIVHYRYPDALDVDYQRLADDAYVIHVWDQDYSYNKWMAHLGLDHRWTLSPVYVK